MPVEEPMPWRKNERLVKDGYRDLEYLPKRRPWWNATLAALAYCARRQLSTSADLSTWAAMNGCAASGRLQDLGDDALVLWHGTSSARAEKIREHGLFSKRGLWTTSEPRIAHGYTRGRSRNPGAGSATVVIVLDRKAFKPEQHYYQASPEIMVFRAGLGPEWVEYILRDDRLEFVGDEKADQPRPWGTARFKRRDGKWVPRSMPPVRLDNAGEYSSKAEWLEMSIRRILSDLGGAAAIEVFSSLYSTIEPWDALSHEEVLEALDRLCYTSGKSFRRFALVDDMTGRLPD